MRDVKTEVEGKIKQATGAALYGQAKDKRMVRRKMPLATRQGLCRNALHRWKSFYATLSKVGPIPRWLWLSASAGSSAVWADTRTTGSARPPELARRVLVQCKRVQWPVSPSRTDRDC